MSKKSPTWEAALEYAARGWPVFPCQPPRAGDAESGKRPLTPNGKDDATCDPRIINVWWGTWPEANVAISCEPAGLVVLDVDVGTHKNGFPKQGRESLKEFDAFLPSTLTALTGGGGLHAIYLAPDDGQPPHKIGLRDGLDLIGRGYFIAAPSLHWTGGQYKWSDVRKIAPLPDVLRHAKKKDTPKDPGLPEPIERASIASGGRNIAIFRLGASLRDSGIGAQALASALHWENQQRCVPPLEDDELKLIVDSILRRVAPSRDVAAGAVLAEEIRQIVQPEPRSMWIYESSAKEQPPMHWYPTGFDQLDILLGGGIATRQVCGVIGPPSAGKSAFIGCIVEKLQTSLPVLHCSTELPREELFVRYAALKMGFPWRDGMKGLYKRADMREAVKDLRIKLVGSDNIDRADPIHSLGREAEALRQEYGVAPAIVVDYVQMLSRGSDDVRQKIGEHTMALRIMSQVLDCPVIAVFSTSRAFYGSDKLEKIREGDDPTAYLAAAKESGDIEFDCATILYLDLDKMHEGQPKPARIAVARCRVGDIGFAGARAALDVGRWWGDASATAEMTVENKKESRQIATVERDQLRILDLVARMPNRSWKDISLASGLGRRAEIARGKLLETGKLESIREIVYDANHKRSTRDILKVGNTGPSPDVPKVEPLP